jgi:hypothetical protein
LEILADVAVEEGEFAKTLRFLRSGSCKAFVNCPSEEGASRQIIENQRAQSRNLDGHKRNLIRELREFARRQGLRPKDGWTAKNAKYGETTNGHEWTRIAVNREMDAGQNMGLVILHLRTRFQRAYPRVL